MKLGMKLATISAVTAIFALGAGAAFAASAHATGNVNVRTGPGTGYQKIDTLHAGENVEVQQCQDGWCYVEHNGPDGWVSASFLGQNGGFAGGNPGNHPQHGGPGSDSDFSFGFSFGNPPGNWPRHPQQWPQQPWPQSKACFYTGANYTGQSFCVTSGQALNFVGPRWNDKISSIRIYGDASATMCQHANYGGFCRTTNRSENALGAWLNDEISAIRVN